MKNKNFNLLFEIFTLITSLIPLYFLFKTSPSQIAVSALVVLGIMICLGVASFIFISGYEKYQSIKRRLEKNEEEMKEIKRDLNLKEQINSMKIRLSVMEKLFNYRKKGGIDPRLVIAILLLALLILFLRIMKII